MRDIIFLLFNFPKTFPNFPKLEIMMKIEKLINKILAMQPIVIHGKFDFTVNYCDQTLLPAV